MDNLNVKKQRHGFVTAWLALFIMVNAITAILYLFKSEMIANSFRGDVSTQMILLGIGSILNVVFVVLIFQWKKIAFWGLIINSIGAFVINSTLGAGLGQSLVGLLGLAFFFGVLQIKKDNVSTWENLE
jgi:uncharacterized membrane protein (DUF485 family)